jgi:hypothetical protein
MNVDIPAAFAAERRRQIDAEGYDRAHDSDHTRGELFLAALAYWQRCVGVTMPTRLAWAASGRSRCRVPVPVIWPWDAEFWKPKSKKRDLERAGALCLAELERLGRLGYSDDYVEATLDHIVQAYESL